MKWITREKVKVDRVACPWLIKKFVDEEAEFVFVPGEKVMAEAKREARTGAGAWTGARRKEGASRSAAAAGAGECIVSWSSSVHAVVDAMEAVVADSVEAGKRRQRGCVVDITGAQPPATLAVQLLQG